MIEVERALDFIRDKADEYAEAKASRVYLEKFRKSKKATIVLESTGTVQQRESLAYANKEYIEVLEGIKIATRAEEALKWKLIAAQLKVEVWRTQQANNRLTDRLHT